MSAFSPCCAAKAPNAFWNYRLTSRRQELGERWDTGNTLISERMRTQKTTVQWYCMWSIHVRMIHAKTHAITHTHTCTHSFIQIWLSLIKFVYMFVFSHCRESNRSRVYPGLVDHFDDTKIDVLSRPRPWQRLSLVSQALWKCHGGREIQEGQGP